MGFSCEPVSEYNIPDLLDLVWFAFVAFGLQVQDLHHARAGEYVVVAPSAFRKSQR
jgi:hypothetical protein